MKKRKNANRIKTTGVIIPVDWDANGNLKAFAISTYNEEEYLINDKTRLGKELSALNQHKVKIIGTLGDRIDNRRVITVSQYELI